jgi:homoserine kinase
MFKVISRASSANVGAGYDCLGLCLSLENVFSLSENDLNIITVNHTEVPKDEEHLVIKTFFDTCDIIGIRPPSSFELTVESEVPLSRGLGSSATCITAGVTFAFLYGGISPNKDIILDISARLEGHPDNVAANIYGSATLAYLSRDGENFRCLNFTVDPKFVFVALIPNFQLSTKMAREVLPHNYKVEDVVFNMSRVSLTMVALQSGDSDLLYEALDDRIHQQYRMPLIEGYNEIVGLAMNAGAIGTYLSGAGPTIMAIGTANEFYENIKRNFRNLEPAWEVKRLEINNEGLECFKLSDFYE